MIPDPQQNPDTDAPLSPELERHLSSPAEKTEEVAGEQDRACRSLESPTEPDASTEQQPT